MACRVRSCVVTVGLLGAMVLVGCNPSVPLGGKLVAPGENGPGRLGTSVALSGDGTTAVAGAPQETFGAPAIGAVWVYALNSAKQMVVQAELTAINEIGAGQFGASVAVSGDGNTLFVGGPANNGGVGAVWVFGRSGTVWLPVVQLIGDPGSGFGTSLALSTDGHTLLVGGPNDKSGLGAVWVYTDGGGSWAQQGPKLTGSPSEGGLFGTSVAVAGDGNTALVGGGALAGRGAAWVFRRTGSTWAQDAELTGTNGGEHGAARFGASVSLSSSGATALVGGPNDSSGLGAAWLFKHSGGAWIQVGSKLTGAGAAGAANFGASVALGTDGQTGFIGGPNDASGVGAAWVFEAKVEGDPLVQTGTKFTGAGASGNPQFGSSVSLSTGGAFSLVGGPGDGGAKGVPGGGAAWTFADPGYFKQPPPGAGSTTGTTTSTTPAARPVVAGVTPASGANTGGTTVTVLGSGFTGATKVRFGTTAGTLASVDSDNRITAVSPAHLGGTGSVHITVTTPGGTSVKGVVDYFKYTKPVSVKPSTTTTTTTTTTKPTTTTGTTTTPSHPKGPVARIVRVSVKRVKGILTLTLRIRVSVHANAKVILRAPGRLPFVGSYTVEGGGNTLVAKVPSRITPGADELTIVLTDSAGRTATYKATVTVPG